MQMDAQDLAGIDLEKLEEALDQKDLQGLPEEQLRKVHKVFLNSTAGSTARPWHCYRIKLWLQKNTTRK
jgi:hypothetical protein